jgi:hypothetical protein
VSSSRLQQHEGEGHYYTSSHHIPARASVATKRSAAFSRDLVGPGVTRDPPPLTPRPFTRSYGGLLLGHVDRHNAVRLAKCGARVRRLSTNFPDSGELASRSEELASKLGATEAQWERAGGRPHDEAGVY